VQPFNLKKKAVPDGRNPLDAMLKKFRTGKKWRNPLF
jgi:hypothetical protein